MTKAYNNHDRLLVAVDCIIFGFDGTEIKALLVKRSLEPEKGKWSLMGGFVGGFVVGFAGAAVTAGAAGVLAGAAGVGLSAISPVRESIPVAISMVAPSAPSRTAARQRARNSATSTSRSGGQVQSNRSPVRCRPCMGADDTNRAVRSGPRRAPGRRAATIPPSRPRSRPKSKPSAKASRSIRGCKAGRPGGTRTPNQGVMSALL